MHKLYKLLLYLNFILPALIISANPIVVTAAPADACYNAVAQKEGDRSLCNKIKSADIKTNCLVNTK